MKNKSIFSGLLLIVFLLSISVNEINAQIAKWSDQSDDLPGLVSDGEMLLIAGGAVVLIGGLVALLVVKKKQDKKLETFNDGFDVLTNFKTVSSIIDVEKDNFNVTSLRSKLNGVSEFKEVYRVPEHMSVQVFTRSNNSIKSSFSCNQGLSVGVRLRF
jgi:hypothetical protein